MTKPRTLDQLSRIGAPRFRVGHYWINRTVEAVGGPNRYCSRCGVTIDDFLRWPTMLCSPETYSTTRSKLVDSPEVLYG